jgi:nicotinate-nucleotide adenylyltransferase
MLGSSSTSLPRVGFFGGSFDPIHNGHFSLATQAIEQANLDTLLLCPAYHAPLRAEKPFFQAKDRLAMLEGIARDHAKIQVFPHEVEQGKVCFTHDTLLAVQEEFPKTEILLLLGVDQFAKLPQWKFIDELLKLVTFLVFSRKSDMTSPHPPLPALKFQQMKNDLIDLSSTLIRQKIQNGKSIRNDIPKPAYNYLNQRNLLQPFATS